MGLFILNNAEGKRTNQNNRRGDHYSTERPVRAQICVLVSAVCSIVMCNLMSTVRLSHGKCIISTSYTLHQFSLSLCYKVLSCRPVSVMVGHAARRNPQNVTVRTFSCMTEASRATLTLIYT